MMDFRAEKYSEEEIRSYISTNNLSSDEWKYISYFQDLSDGFIRDFKNEVHWDCISIKQNRSESFIREFAELVHWKFISYRNQVLSRSFKYLMHDKVRVKTIRTHKNPKEVL